MAAKQYRVTEFGAGNPKLMFFFCGMATRIWLYRGPVRRLVKVGYHVIAYDFDPWIVRDGDVNNFLQVGEQVNADTKQQIRRAKREGVRVFHAFGTSMGTLFAIKLAAENAEVSKVIINLTYGSVAENVWTWRYLRKLKQRCVAQGYTMKSLDKALAPISPIPNAPKLKGKKVLLYLPRRDKILRFEQSIQFREALLAAGVEHTYRENKYFGHIISGFINFLHPRIYIEFLAEKET